MILADGGEAIADLVVSRDQAGLSGPVSSDATAWRQLAQLDGPALAQLRAAPIKVREVAWAQTTRRVALPAPASRQT